MANVEAGRWGWVDLATYNGAQAGSSLSLWLLVMGVAARGLEYLSSRWVVRCSPGALVVREEKRIHVRRRPLFTFGSDSFILICELHMRYSRIQEKGTALLTITDHCGWKVGVSSTLVTNIISSQSRLGIGAVFGQGRTGIVTHRNTLLRP